MKQIRDVIVIGSGIIGSAIAYGLTRAGTRRVTLIDKGPLTSGMTRRSAGIAHPFHTDALMCKLANASYDFYAQSAILLGGKNLFTETGAAVVSNDLSVEPFETWTQFAEGARVSEPQAFAALFPNVSENLRRILFTPRGGYADAVLTAQAMVNAAKERGLEVQTGTQVKQIRGESARIQGVKTTAGDLESPIVIVAAGGWSDKLLAPLGVTLPFQVQRGALAFYEQPKTITSELPMLLDAKGDSFFRPHPYHMSAVGIVAATAQTQRVDAFDDYVSANELAQANAFASFYVPAFANVPPKRAHAILYNSARDGLPYLGKIPSYDSLYIAAGFGASAFSVAPAVGENIAQMVIDGNATLDVSSFNPLR